MSESLTIEKGASSIGRVAGRIDVNNASSALSRGSALFAVGKQLEADVSGLQSADSITLAVLLAWAVRASKSGGKLSYKGASSRLQAIAHLGDAEALLGFDAAGGNAPQGRSAA